MVYSNAQSETSPWHILGCGAIGSLWANYLMKANIPAVVLCRTPEVLDGYWDNPFLTLIEGGTRHKYQPITEMISHPKPIKQLLVTTKSYDTVDALNSIAHRITPETRIVLLQNGMGVQRRISDLFPNNPVYCGTTTEGAYRTGPQQVIHAGIGETWFGPYNSAAEQAGKSAIKSLFNIELTSYYEDDISNRLWKKLAINCAINGLTAIYDCHNGELLKNNKYRQELKTLCDEFEQFAHKLGQPLFSEPLFNAVSAVATSTAENISSTLQDIRKQRRTEIDYLNGFICRKAKENGLELPNHQRVLMQVKELSKEDNRTFNTLG